MSFNREQATGKIILIAFVTCWFPAIVICPITAIAFFASNDYSYKKIIEILLVQIFFIPYTFIGPILNYRAYFRDDLKHSGYWGPVLTLYLTLIAVDAYFGQGASLLFPIIIGLSAIASLLLIKRTLDFDYSSTGKKYLLLIFLLCTLHFALCTFLYTINGMKTIFW